MPCEPAPGVWQCHRSYHKSIKVTVKLLSEVRETLIIRERAKLREKSGNVFG